MNVMYKMRFLVVIVFVASCHIQGSGSSQLSSLRKVVAASHLSRFTLPSIVKGAAPTSCDAAKDLPKKRVPVPPAGGSPRPVSGKRGRVISLPSITEGSAQEVFYMTKAGRALIPDEIKIVDCCAGEMVDVLQRSGLVQADDYFSFFKKKITYYWGTIHPKLFFNFFKKGISALFTMKCQAGAGAYVHAFPEPYEKLRLFKDVFGGRFHDSCIDEECIDQLSSIFPAKKMFIKGDWASRYASKRVCDSLLACIELMLLDVGWKACEIHSDIERDSFVLGVYLAFLAWYRMYVDGSMPLNN